MSGSGRGGNKRRNQRRFHGRKDESFQKNERKQHDDNDGKNRLPQHERPRWTAPKPPADPVSAHNCPWCGKPIKDITAALSDRSTGLPVHFDCVLAHISELETLETNDSVCYIGGGRFGIVHYNNPPDTRNFTIKKIFEWEDKDNRNEWRQFFSDYFSVT
ncbi:MAG: hypothetical protein LBG91_02870 [Treponema sp.]|jgi:hypothetical protein|nr:hypothetical protein [Treponema sp.]